MFKILNEKLNEEEVYFTLKRYEGYITLVATDKNGDELEAGLILSIKNGQICTWSCCRVPGLEVDEDGYAIIGRMD